METVKPILFSVIASLVVVLAYDMTRVKQPRLAVIDVQSIINDKKQDLLSNTKEEALIKQEASRFSKVLDDVIKTTAKNNNLVLVTKAAVYAGTPEDVTGIIKTRVNEIMAAASPVPPLAANSSGDGS